MEVANLVFEEAKLRIASKLKKLKDLDDMKRKLKEQLFILDLQQEVSIKRYKKYLQMIGEHQQRENNRYISSQSLDESNSYLSIESFLKSINKKIPIVSSQKVEDEKISNAKVKLDQYKIFINQKKEIYFNLSKQDELIVNVLKMLKQQDHSENKKIIQPISTSSPNSDYSLQLETILNKINDQKTQKTRLLTDREGLYREVTIMSKIEKEMQNQMLILQKEAYTLVEKRKWHPNFENTESSKNTNLGIYNSSLSIP